MSEGQESAKQPSSTQLHQNRRVLLGIFGIPALVFALSSILYYLVDSGVIELGTVNNGELIVPPLHLTDIHLQRMDGSEFDYSQPEPLWTFLVIGDDACNGDCERMLYVARQSVVALGKKMNQMRLGYLTQTGSIDTQLEQRFETEYRGIEVFTAKEDQLQALFADSVANTAQPRTFFVVDPQGWLMMYYQAEATDQDSLNTLGKAVVSDMKRLLD